MKHQDGYWIGSWNIEYSRKKGKNWTAEIPSSEVKVLDNIIPHKMRRAQMGDKDIVEVIKDVEMHEKAPSYLNVRKFRSAVVRKYLLQVDRLILIKGVLHQTHAQDEAKFHQLVLPPECRPEVLKLLHDDQGHQTIAWTLSLLHEHFIGAQCMWMLPDQSRTVIGVK